MKKRFKGPEKRSGRGRGEGNTRADAESAGHVLETTPGAWRPYCVWVSPQKRDFTFFFLSLRSTFFWFRYTQDS